MAKKLFSRESIIEAAYSLSLEVGINKIKIKEVADVLGCSVMPIYEEFGTKEELIHAVSSFSAKNSLSNDKVSSLVDRYEKILEFGLHSSEQLLDFANVKRKFPHQGGVYDDLFQLMRTQKGLENCDEQELFDINFIIETFILGFAYRYRNSEYSKQVSVGVKNDLHRLINGLIKKKAD